ncbi:efflux RND transporter permease subunit [Desulfosarcina cetonica]|uniref:efflux RND transporter permease subunit n=1 Tax=Desulfosarcina cetonica TaxID=90730 RepID=UPI0006D0E77B|nr:efflux RND transporter permease subunit [Desulfosarcina cetonica]
MNWVSAYLKKPHGIIALILLGTIFGVIGFNTLPLNLFPDSNYPQVSVLLNWPGAAAKDMADKVSRKVEKEMATLDKFRTVKSTIRDETAAVRVEFEYTKSLDAAVTDVNAALNRILPSLPSDLPAPRIFRVSDATAPVQTLAVYPKAGSLMALSKVRQICDNEIQDELLRVSGIADVEVFGGYVPEIRLVIKRDRLARYGLTADQVAAAVYALNRNMPSGTLFSRSSEQVIIIRGERDLRYQLEEIVLSRDGRSGTIHLRDVADVTTTAQERRSFFRGNGRPAIGLNILRGEGESVTGALSALGKALPGIRASFPELVFEVADTQGELIQTSVSNLIGALRDSVILTVMVIFLILARIRTTLLAAISIPFTFFMTFAGMKLIGYELNIVTMTAIILAVGLLVDDAIVVIENIDRHAAPGNKPLFQAAVDGTREIFLADFAGTATTLAVLIPIMFVGGYSQKILRPLSVVLSLALLSSYIVSVTVIPLLAPKLMKTGQGANRVERIVEKTTAFWLLPMQRFFVRCFRLSMGKWGWLFPVLMMVLLIVSLRQMPLAGRDLMPPMDTGIVKVSFDVWPNSPLAVTERVAAEMEKRIMAVPGFLRMATLVGAEPDVISFGADRTSQEGLITVHFKNRFEREKSIWEIEAELRDSFSKIPGLKRADVYDYGATPLSSIAAPIDVMISGPDPRLLDQLAAEVEKRLRSIHGLTSVSRSWDWSKREIAINLDETRLARYGLSPSDVSAMMTAATTGRVASQFSIAAQNGYNVRLRFDAAAMTTISDLESLQIVGPEGPIPLSEIADIGQVFRQARITRQDLLPVVNVLGYRDRTAITHLQDQVQRVLSDVKLPAGYLITQEGEIRQMRESFAELGLAMGLAILFLYFSMVVTFSSYLRPVIIMSAIPLAFIGVPWGMLLLERHFCMPAAMGMILLGGIVVNNSILLVDFIETARAEGTGLHDAIEQAIFRRTRPILMTALSTVAGMLPVAAQSAVGLERLSPLAVVAIAGLLVSTFLTLAWVPALYAGLARLKGKLKSFNEHYKPYDQRIS